MPLTNVSREQLLRVISELEQSLYNHQQWHNMVVRTLICKLPPDNHDICANPHQECRFGQWYYGEAPASLRDHPGFTALGIEHQYMHQLAAHLLNATFLGDTVSAHDYDNFANATERVRLELLALKRELEDLLYNRDPLTLVTNRVNMLPSLREQQSLAKRHNYSCILIMMDVDYFKNINEVHGHIAGDKLLAAVAHYLIEHLRPYDKIFRYGGEEFLLCLPNIELPAAVEMIERVRIGLAENQVHLDEKKSINVTASFGVTLLDPYSPIESSIEHADRAMYAAKSAGKNCIRLWDESMSSLKQ